MASNLLIFPRINQPQCFKSTPKFGGLATIWRACAPQTPPPDPSVEPLRTGSGRVARQAARYGTTKHLLGDHEAIIRRTGAARPGLTLN